MPKFACHSSQTVYCNCCKNFFCSAPLLKTGLLSSLLHRHCYSYCFKNCTELRRAPPSPILETTIYRVFIYLIIFKVLAAW